MLQKGEPYAMSGKRVFYSKGSDDSFYNTGFIQASHIINSPIQLN